MKSRINWLSKDEAREEGLWIGRLPEAEPKNRINWDKAAGAALILVSAAVTVYLAYWAWQIWRIWA